MKCLVMLITQILLELFIFPYLHDRLLSRTTIHFLSILNTVYSTRNGLKKHSRFLPILVVALDYLFGKFVVIHLYDSRCKYFDSLHSLVMIVITIIPFVLLTSDEDLEEFERAKFIQFIQSGFLNTIFVYKLFYFYKHFHLQQGNFVEFNGKIDFFYHMVIDFFANMGSFTLKNLLTYFLEKKSKRSVKSLVVIVKKFILMYFLTFLFYSVYSFGLARAVFQYIHDRVPNTHNLILYNLLPKDRHIRFRLFVYICNWFFM